MNEFTFLLLWALVLIEGALLLGTLRQLGRLASRLGPELPLYQTSAIVSVLPVDRLRETTRELRLVLFVSPSCGVCEQVLRGLDKRISRSVQLTLVAGTSEARAREYASAHGLGDAEVISDVDGEFAAASGVHEVPVAVLTRRGGFVISSAIVNSGAQVESMVRAGERDAA